MNTFERRRLIKARVIDVAVAKTAIQHSRRQRAESTKALRKALAAHALAATENETTVYPLQSVG